MKLKCPFCGSTRMRKAGFNYLASGKRQRYDCKNCHRITIKPKKGGK